jgi:hypothetical protein
MLTNGSPTAEKPALLLASMVLIRRALFGVGDSGQIASAGAFIL